MTIKEIITELERRKRNVSFDSELIMDKPTKDLDIENFEQEYQEKTGENLVRKIIKYRNVKFSV